MKHGFFKDSDGNVSSKRVTGFVAMMIGLIMGLALFFLSIFTGVKDSSTAMQVFVAFISSGGGLLGIGTFEKLRGKK